MVIELVQGLCWEHAVTLIIIMVGAFTSVGGLGGTFYVCYCSCVLFFVFSITIIVKLLFHNEDLIGMSKRVFNLKFPMYM